MNETWNCEVPKAQFFTCLSQVDLNHPEDPGSTRGQQDKSYVLLLLLESENGQVQWQQPPEG